MNKNLLIGLAIIILIILIAFLWYQQAEAPTATTEDFNGAVGALISFEGRVIAVDRNEIAFDGPYRFVVETNDGRQANVAIPSMGLPMCAAFKAGAIKDPNTIEIGQAISIAGVVGEDGATVPCDDGHYVR